MRPASTSVETDRFFERESPRLKSPKTEMDAVVTQPPERAVARIVLPGPFILTLSIRNAKAISAESGREKKKTSSKLDNRSGGWYYISRRRERQERKDEAKSRIDSKKSETTTAKALFDSRIL